METNKQQNDAGRDDTWGDGYTRDTRVDTTRETWLGYANLIVAVLLLAIALPIYLVLWPVWVGIKKTVRKARQLSSVPKG